MRDVGRSRLLPASLGRDVVLLPASLGRDVGRRQKIAPSIDTVRRILRGQAKRGPILILPRNPEDGHVRDFMSRIFTVAVIFFQIE
jgi:hypothetical protein